MYNVEGGTDYIKELFGLAREGVKAYTAKELAQTAPALGVDEHGRVYERGAPSSALAGVPPVALVLGGLALVGLVVYLAKN